MDYLNSYQLYKIMNMLFIYLVINTDFYHFYHIPNLKLVHVQPSEMETWLVFCPQWHSRAAYQDTRINTEKP